MTDMMIAPPLQAALTARGYDALTPVQQAVLADGGTRDLLVSAQTGSGKTVAFGLAIAGQILGDAPQLLYADKPLALIIAPTRELALQVAREFEWLYAGAMAQVATCVGGMDYRTERRALDRGAHVVVGTPGRLRDHIERGSLDLTGLRAVVLDEADEMLDLGFREDLEFILAAAPAERRTLMFSATVPAEIAALAKTFQQDALRLQVAGEAKQHADITYRAYSVQARDHDHAIFNLLRFHEADRAIVFCKTRANVNHLLGRMANRGFPVVALSGELSQSERTHALQALRDGRARVCIATDVAARGIDLPGLELVIHADLPSNPDTLLHRSGRTGRAGRKGISALIVPPAEFRKAHRVLSAAKVTAEWGPPPGADDVQARDDARLMDDPSFTAAPGNEGEMAAALVDRYGAEAVAQAFVRLWRAGRSAPEELHDAAVAPAAPPGPPRERAAFGPAVWFRLNAGHDKRAEARWLLPKICEAGGISRDGIGAIRVKQEDSFVQIAEAMAGRFGQGLDLEPGLTMTRLDGEPDLDRPTPRREERAPRPAPRDRDDRPQRSAPTYDKPAYDKPAREKPAYTPKPPRVVEDDAARFTPDAAPLADEARPARKPRWKDGAPAQPKSAGFRSHGGSPDRPARSEGYKSHAADGAKPWKKRDDAPRGDGERKPYAPRAEGDRKPWAPRPDGERKPYAPRKDAEGKPPFRKDDTDRKPWRKPEGDAASPAKKPWRKPEGDGAAPAKKPWRKDAADGAKPFRKAEGDGKKPFKKADGDRPFAKKAGDGKPFRKSDAPKRPPADARDTSKRFVPPRKPKA
jgi:ATP-dependent RNA helicase DeaD